MLSNFQWNKNKNKKKNRTPIYMRAARILEQEGCRLLECIDAEYGYGFFSQKK